MLFDFQEFIKELNKMTGKEFHLPTEAEWEFAARGGDYGKEHHYQFAGSNSVNLVAWFTGNSKNRTHPVGEKNPNELGLYDMSGNVCEWCLDRYNGSYYINSPVKDPSGPLTGKDRVIRGGGWIASDWSCRVLSRGSCIPTSHSDDIGLRLAL